MPKHCINHPGQASITMCHHCHKPICKSCTMIAPNGSFCSSECSVLFREFKGRMSTGVTRGTGAATKMVVGFMVLCLIVLAIHLAVRGGVEEAQKIDIIGWLIGYKFVPPLQ